MGQGGHGRPPSSPEAEWPRWVVGHLQAPTDALVPSCSCTNHLQWPSTAGKGGGPSEASWGWPQDHGHCPHHQLAFMKFWWWQLDLNQKRAMHAH